MQEILDKYEVETADEYFATMLFAANIGAVQFAKDMFSELNTSELLKQFNQFVNDRGKLETFLNTIKHD